jgi:hypothetical protein
MTGRVASQKTLVSELFQPLEQWGATGATALRLQLQASFYWWDLVAGACNPLNLDFSWTAA